MLRVAAWLTNSIERLPLSMALKRVDATMTRTKLRGTSRESVPSTPGKKVKRETSSQLATRIPPSRPDGDVGPYDDETFFGQVPASEPLDEANSTVGGLSPVAIRLLQAASDMRESPDSYERAFLARQLIQCTFPHSDPGNVPIWSRTNGNLTLSIRPLYHEESETYRYPYGTIPRLFLYWMVTEAARTKSRRLHLGQTYPDFMRKLGLNPSNGGARSDSRRLRDQIERMLRATISFKQTFRSNGRTGDAWLDMQIGPKLSSGGTLTRVPKTHSSRAISSSVKSSFTQLRQAPFRWTCGLYVPSGNHRYH